MKNWIVSTGGQSWLGQGETPLEAAADAFKTHWREWKGMGLICSVRQPHETDEEGYVVATAHALDKAGLNFKLKETCPDKFREIVEARK